MLTNQQKDAYKQHGFVVLHELFSAKQMDKLKQQANQIVEEFDPASTRSIFSTKSQDTNRDDYFLTSEDKIRCFFEEEAFDENGELVQEKNLSINKIGHALHRLHPDFKAFSHQAIIKDIAVDLGLVKPQIHQSMYIFKQPKIGGEIRWHQDASYFFTEPQTVITYWLAIEDATIENGCLQVESAGQKSPLREQFVRYPNDQTELIKLSDMPWPQDEIAQPLEVKKGTLVVFHGALPHFSAPNRSAYSRHAYTLHMTCDLAEYSVKNWIQTPGSRL